MFQVQGRQYFCPKLFQQHYNIPLLTKIGSCDFNSQPKKKDNYFHGPFLEKLLKYCKTTESVVKKMLDLIFFHPRNYALNYTFPNNPMVCFALTPCIGSEVYRKNVFFSIKQTLKHVTWE